MCTIVDRKRFDRAHFSSIFSNDNTLNDDDDVSLNEKLFISTMQSILYVDNRDFTIIVRSVKRVSINWISASRWRDEIHVSFSNFCLLPRAIIISLIKCYRVT